MYCVRILRRRNCCELVSLDDDKDFAYVRACRWYGEINKIDKHGISLETLDRNRISNGKK